MGPSREEEGSCTSGEDSSLWATPALGPSCWEMVVSEFAPCAFSNRTVVVMRIGPFGPYLSVAPRADLPMTQKLR